MTRRLLLAYKPVALLLVLLTVTTVVTAVTMFTHSFPAVTVSAITTNCASPGLSDPSEPVEAGVAGQATFQCSGPNPAFRTSGAVSATPSFSGFVAPYQSMWIYTWNGGTITGACSGRTDAQKIVHAVTEAIPANPSPNGWDYCAEFSSANSGGLSAFTVAWAIP